MRAIPIAIAACLVLAATPALARRHHHAPPPPPRVWRYVEAGRSPRLEYGYAARPDPRRTSLTCENSGVVRVEQAQPGRPGGGSNLVVGSGGESAAASAEEHPDPSGGRAISATFTIDQPVIRGFASSGELQLA